MIVAAAGSSANVTGTIRQAAALTGANFDYLLATAKVESRLDAGATAPTSSATGLFQFIEQTWLATLKQAGPTFGYGQYAAAITRTNSGSYTVEDPTMRQKVLGLREDATANALMAGIFTRQNAAKLNDQLGRSASDGELYIAHFLGASGATRLISAASTQPSTRAADLFPAAAGKNRSIFYDKSGSARTVGQVYQLLVGRYEAARTGATTAVAAKAQPGQSAKVAAAAVATATATTETNSTSQEAAVQTGPVFHTLFSTGERREAVAPGINALWTGQGGSNAAATTSANPVPRAFDVPPAGSVNLRELFTTGS